MRPGNTDDPHRRVYPGVEIALPDGDTFVGWGNLNAVSEFGRHGHVIYDARFPTGVNTYRAYLLKWHPTS